MVSSRNEIDLLENYLHSIGQQHKRLNMNVQRMRFLNLLEWNNPSVVDVLLKSINQNINWKSKNFVLKYSFIYNWEKESQISV